MNRPRLVRAVGWILLTPLVLQLTYVLAANTLLVSGVIQRAANIHPDQVELTWDSAYTPWPGRLYVTGFSLRVQDAVSAFRITIEDGQADVVLNELFHQRFRARRLDATGVRYRFVAKVQKPEGSERRLEAFPPMDGLPTAGLPQDPPPRAATAEELAALWTVQVDDLAMSFDEVWMVEFRYLGRARFKGSMLLVPLLTIAVGPSRFEFDGGRLTAGKHLIAPEFKANATLEMARLDLPSSPGLRMIHTLTATAQFETDVADVGLARLYANNLEVAGTGHVVAELRVVQGKLMPGSQLTATLPETDVALEGYRFVGESAVALTVDESPPNPRIHATLTGDLSLPLPMLQEKDVLARVTDTNGTITLDDNDLSTGLGGWRLFAEIGEAKVEDARGITRTIGKVVPVVAPFVLGDGPLLASATAYMTPDYTLVRLKQLKLGDAELSGAAVPGALGWSGAVGGHFGGLRVGLRARLNQLESAVFIPDTWLDASLVAAGIEPDR